MDGSNPVSGGPQRYGVRHIAPPQKPVAFRGHVAEKEKTPFDLSSWGAPPGIDPASDFSSIARSPHMVFHESTPSVLFYPTPVDYFPTDCQHGEGTEYEERGGVNANLLSPRKSQSPPLHGSVDGVARPISIASAADNVWGEASDSDTSPRWLRFAPAQRTPEPELMESDEHHSRGLLSTGSQPSRRTPPHPSGVSSTYALPSAETATTLMLRGVPNKYTRDMLLEELEVRGFLIDVDFFYMPFFPGAQRNVGYCFINLISMDAANRFRAAFEGTKLVKVKSDKTCQVSVGKVQGRDTNIDAYRNSAVMTLNEKHQPMLFKNGKPESFPSPIDS